MAHTASTDSRTPTALLCPDEVAAILRVTPRTVRAWGASGRLTRIRLGDRLTRYTVDSVEALIHPSTSEAPAGNQGFANTDAVTSDGLPGA